MTLTEFLFARIAEDEASAREIPRGSWEDACSETRRHDHVFRWSPERVLAECEAKRRIVDQCADATHDAFAADYDLAPRYDLGWDVLCALALPYADHDDYREEWKP